MTDNYDQIRELLNWRTKDDFYFLQIIQRKKDHNAIVFKPADKSSFDGSGVNKWLADEVGQYTPAKVNGCNNNSRLVKAYYIKSLEHFDFIKPEVIELCKVFNARAGINLNRRSFEKMALQHLKKITDQLINGDSMKAYKAYSSVVGAYSQDKDKKWILDIDEIGDEVGLLDALFVKGVRDYLKTIKPDGDKFIAEIPSKSGYHIITKPFDLQAFRQKFPEIEVHKNNPTNLYIP